MKASTFVTRDSLLLFLALVVGFALAVGFSVRAATTVSTNLVTDGHVKATSTVQAGGDLIGYGSLLVGGTTSEAVSNGLNVGGVTGTARSAYITGGLGVENATTSTGDFLVGDDFRVFSNGAVAVGATTSPILTSASLSLGGAAGTHADLYVSGGLGVGNATTSDGDFIVGNDFSVFANGAVAVGATTSPILTGQSLSLGAAAGTHVDMYVSGGVGIGNATTTDGILETSGIGFIGGLLKVKGTGTSTISGHFLVDNDFTVFSNGRVAVGATTSPILAGPSLSLGGAAGTHADLYVSGGFGVANATTSDGDLIVGTSPVLSFTNNGRLVVGATSTALSAANSHKFVFDGGSMSLSSGSTATTSLSIMTEATNADQGNSCIEMKRGTSIVSITLNSAGSAFLFTAGACGGN